MSADLELSFLFIRVREHFRDINEDEGLTQEDKRRLKEYYLAHFVTPEARKLLESKLAEEARREERRRQRFTRRPHSHQP